jgi:hypothetical protein
MCWKKARLFNSFAPVPSLTEYLVKINSADFEKATHVLNDYESQFTDDVEARLLSVRFHYYRVAGYYSTNAMNGALLIMHWPKKCLQNGGIPIDEAAEKRYKKNG